ncbi:MAG: serine/threonine-protein kinase, partial [Armatimonadota bacterium]
LGQSAHGAVLQGFGREGQRVVVKMVSAAADSPGRGVRAALRTELEAISRLAHPNIVSLLDWGEHNEMPYLVTEYCDGLSVFDVLVLAGQFSLMRTLEVLSDACEGLSVAHAQGIIHRDIKPGNIMLVRNGPAKLGDFGVAATREDALGSRKKVIAGTVPYMSPEQSRGEVLDARSDVWALGATMYEMLSGTLPFPGGSHRVVLQKIREEQPRALEGRGAALSEIVFKCLEKDRTARYRSARELGGVLRMAVEQQL